jgi:hypothetical protein
MKTTHTRLTTLLAGTLMLCTTSAFAQSKLQVLADGRPELTKLDSDLLKARISERAGASFAQRLSQLSPASARGAQVQVTIAATTLTDDLRNAVRAAGLTIVHEFEGYGIAHLNVLATSSLQLELLAVRNDIRLIQTMPEPKVHIGIANNQGDVGMDGYTLRLEGINGTGVKVGILSDSFARTGSVGGTVSSGILTGSNPQNSGDLPASVQILDDSASGTLIDEGAGMAEIIYDVAPGCDIAFATAFNGHASFAANIDALVNAGCDVIVDDVGYADSAMYQDGPIALAAANAVASGVPYYSSAGNSASDALEENFLDSNPANDLTFPPSGNDLHLFDGPFVDSAFIALTLAPGEQLRAALHWQQPYGGGSAAGPGAAADLDLYVLSSTILPITNGTILASGTNTQGTLAAPMGDAVEFAAYTNPSGTTEQIVYVCVDRFLDDDVANPGKIHLYLDGGTLNNLFDFGPLLNDRTLWGHSAGTGVVSVAAMDYRELNTATHDPAIGYNAEYFSSKGGAALPFHYDGNGNAQSLQTRQHPVLTAPDGVDTTFFGSSDPDGTGFPNFYGTSAAAPQVAACTALLLQLYPSLTPAQITQRFVSSAQDAAPSGVNIGSAIGWDDITGYGVVNVYNAATAGTLFCDFGYVGTEAGLLHLPYNTVTEAHNVASPGALIYIRNGGHSTETLTITKNVTLDASSPARIGGTGNPPPAACIGGNGDCLADNGTPGCNNQTCCVTVCAIDPFCCDTQWDDLCADSAATECDL